MIIFGLWSEFSSILLVIIKDFVVSPMIIFGTCDFSSILLVLYKRLCGFSDDNLWYIFERRPTGCLERAEVNSSVKTKFPPEFGLQSGLPVPQCPCHHRKLVKLISNFQFSNFKFSLHISKGF